MRKIGLLVILGMGVYVLAMTPRPLLLRTSTDIGDWLASQEKTLANYVLSHPSWRRELRHDALLLGNRNNT